MARPVITLTTDFGTADTFVGEMKGVILGVNPDAAIVDLTHDIPPHDIVAGAYLLGAAYRQFPPGTVHVAVVDPGVGTARRPLAVSGPNAAFVCPDNGLLSYVLEYEGGSVPNSPPLEVGEAGLPPGWVAYHLKNDRYWRRPVSATFHGRDIFASVAAYLSAGEPAAKMGPEAVSVQAFPVLRPLSANGRIDGAVVHVDRFGNLVTNIGAALLPSSGKRSSSRSVVSRTTGLADSYQSGGALLAIVGSQGTLEIAARNGSAAAELGVGVGGSVVVVDVELDEPVPVAARARPSSCGK